MSNKKGFSAAGVYQGIQNDSSLPLIQGATIDTSGSSMFDDGFQIDYLASNQQVLTICFPDIALFYLQKDSYPLPRGPNSTEPNLADRRRKTIDRYFNLNQIKEKGTDQKSRNQIIPVIAVRIQRFNNNLTIELLKARFKHDVALTIDQFHEQLNNNSTVHHQWNDTVNFIFQKLSSQETEFSLVNVNSDFITKLSAIANIAATRALIKIIDNDSTQKPRFIYETQGVRVPHLSSSDIFHDPKKINEALTPYDIQGQPVLDQAYHWEHATKEYTLDRTPSMTKGGNFIIRLSSPLRSWVDAHNIFMASLLLGEQQHPYTMNQPLPTRVDQAIKNYSQLKQKRRDEQAQTQNRKRIKALLDPKHIEKLSASHMADILIFLGNNPKEREKLYGCFFKNNTPSLHHYLSQNIMNLDATMGSTALQEGGNLKNSLTVQFIKHIQKQHKDFLREQSDQFLDFLLYKQIQHLLSTIENIPNINLLYACTQIKQNTEYARTVFNLATNFIMRKNLAQDIVRLAIKKHNLFDEMYLIEKRNDREKLIAFQPVLRKGNEYFSIPIIPFDKISDASNAKQQTYQQLFLAITQQAALCEKNDSLLGWADPKTRQAFEDKIKKHVRSIATSQERKSKPKPKPKPKPRPEKPQKAHKPKLLTTKMPIFSGYTIQTKPSSPAGQPENPEPISFGFHIERIKGTDDIACQYFIVAPEKSHIEHGLVRTDKKYTPALTMSFILSEGKIKDIQAKRGLFQNIKTLMPSHITQHLRKKNASSILWRAYVALITDQRENQSSQNSLNSQMFLKIMTEHIHKLAFLIARQENLDMIYHDQPIAINNHGQEQIYFTIDDYNKTVQHTPNGLLKDHSIIDRRALQPLYSREPRGVFTDKDGDTHAPITDPIHQKIDRLNVMTLWAHTNHEPPPVKVSYIERLILQENRETRHSPQGCSNEVKKIQRAINSESLSTLSQSEMQSLNDNNFYQLCYKNLLSAEHLNHLQESEKSAVQNLLLREIDRRLLLSIKTSNTPVDTSLVAMRLLVKPKDKPDWLSNLIKRNATAYNILRQMVKKLHIYPEIYFHQIERGNNKVAYKAVLVKKDGTTQETPDDFLLFIKKTQTNKQELLRYGALGLINALCNGFVPTKQCETCEKKTKNSMKKATPN